MLKKLNLCILCFILAVTFSLSGCNGEADSDDSNSSSPSIKENEASKTKKTKKNSKGAEGESWVFYWYLCGSDLEMLPLSLKQVVHPLGKTTLTLMY